MTLEENIAYLSAHSRKHNISYFIREELIEVIANIVRSDDEPVPKKIFEVMLFVGTTMHRPGSYSNKFKPISDEMQSTIVPFAMVNNVVFVKNADDAVTFLLQFGHLIER